MKELEMLLNQRWILKAEDKELYREAGLSDPGQFPDD